MKTKPILFSTEMVQAILEGRKTQTRRVVKGLEELNEPFFQSLVQHASGLITFSSLDSNKVIEPKNTYGNIGDILWVRETWSYGSDSLPFIYKSGYPNNIPNHFENIPDISEIKWKPSIHMPKEAARIFLKITNVRVERLFDISGEDAIAEGIDFSIINNIKEYRDYLVNDTEHVFGKNSFPSTPQASFLSLWEKINGLESVNSNPWVWVIEFERVEKPLNF